MREILDAEILFISLCPLGKNGLATLFKAEDAQAHFQGVSKALEDFEEKGQLVACVWAPDRACSEGDFASPAAVEKMAHSFMRNAGKVDTLHNLNPLPPEAAYVAESFIIQANDSRFTGMKDYDGTSVDVVGGWGVVMQINDPALRKAYRDGEWAGVSMYGPARVRDAELDKAKVNALRDIITNKETDMKPEEIKAIFAEGLSEFAKSDEFVAAVKAAAPVAVEEKPEEKPEVKVEKAPAPEGVDADDHEALLKHAETMDNEAAKAAVNWDDPTSVREYAETVKKSQAPKKAKPSKLVKGKGDDAVEGDDDEAVLVAKGRALAAHLNKKYAVRK